jgi:phage terminase large subunit
MIISELKSLKLSKSLEIFADSADPRLITEICEGGYNAVPTEKFKGSILTGIGVLGKYNVIIHHSPNIWKERNLYSWRKKGADVLNEPIDKHNHAMDAIRYYALGMLAEKGAAATIVKQQI